MHSPRTPYVTIAAGHTKHRHLGDDLVVRSVLEELDDTMPSAHPTILAEDPDIVARRFDVRTSYTATRLINAEWANPDTALPDRVASISNDAHAHLNSDASVDPRIALLAEHLAHSESFVIAPAGSLTSAYANWMLWPRLTEALIASEASVPIEVRGAGLGPFSDESHLDALRTLLALANTISVRDEPSREIAIEAGFEAVSVVPDLATTVQPANTSDVSDLLADLGIDTNEYIVVSARGSDPDRTLRRIAKAIDAHTAESADGVVLLPHVEGSDEDDIGALRRIATHVASSARVIAINQMPEDDVAAGVIRGSALSLGTRFHNGVLAAASGRRSQLFAVTAYDEARIEGLKHLYPDLIGREGFVPEVRR
jgi:polysaccharide pyruvyl transferase WcaK-like protein